MEKDVDNPIFSEVLVFKTNVSLDKEVVKVGVHVYASHFFYVRLVIYTFTTKTGIFNSWRTELTVCP